ncbi:SGNH/GDSL hydrolase family protein [Agrobacterium tumefaciens]|uniref:SGNH/GDSL hydrolase family protein n=1 Tax=Agrobacterium tumefaciens TaxID=358 RepID=UPI003BA268A6
MSTTAPDERITTYNPVVPTTEFPVLFPIFANNDLSVYLDGVERFDFTVTASYDEGVSNNAKVIMNTGVTGSVIIVGERDPRRQNRFLNGGPLPIKDMNLAFDALEGEMQEARRDIKRSVRSEIGQPGFILDPDLVDGDVPMKQGDRFVPGPNLPNLASSLIAEATAQANRAQEEADRSDREADRADAEADRAAGYVSDMASEKEVPIYATAAGLSGVVIDLGFGVIEVKGWFAEADGRGGKLERLSSQPLHRPSVQSADGAWWGLINLRNPTSLGYRLNTPSPGRRAASPRSDSLIPEKHLRRFLGTPNPVVVFVGDSLMTVNSNGSDGMNEQCKKLEVKFRREFPEKSITFYNRAIAGLRMAQLGVAITSVNQTVYPWYTDVNREWWKYISDLNPDLIVVSFGMNDGAFFVTNGTLQWIGYSEKGFLGLEGQNKKPDIVLVSNFLPTIAYPGASTLTKAQQEARDVAAGLIRTLAAERGYGLIDINHWFNQARDGIDILSQEYQRIHNAAALPFPWTSAVECRAFFLRAVFSNIGSVIFQSEALRLGVSPEDVILVSNNAGKLRVAYYKENGWSTYRVDTDISTPAIGATITVECEVVGDRIILRINDAVVFDACPLRNGGLFTPSVSYGTPSTPGDPFTLTFRAGVDAPVNAVFLDSDLYNTTGGNQLNHPCASGSDLTWDPPLQRISFGAPYVSRPIGGSALAMLPYHSGLAVDFERDEYAIRSRQTPSLDAIGKPQDIVSFVSGGPYARYYDPNTGEPVGYRVTASLPYILGTAFGFSGAEGSLIVEAKVDDETVTSYIASLSVMAP